MASQKPSALQAKTSSKSTSTQEHSPRTNALPTPIKCPACSKVQMVPESVDVEVAMLRQFAKCMTSSDPACVKATQHPSMAMVRARVEAQERKS